VLSGAVERVEGEATAGDVVLVVDHRGKSIGTGFFAPDSQIRVRMLTRDPGEEIDAAFLHRRIRRAARLRASLDLPGPDTDVFRAVHGSGDGLPGVVADIYGKHAVLQLTVRGMESRRREIAEALAESFGVEGVLLRPVTAFQRAEGLEGCRGDLLPAPVPEEIEVKEDGLVFLVDPHRGQKTGHYADHRENRALVGTLARGRALDAFCGTGGFALAAARGGAEEVVAADSSPPAIERAARNAERNGVSERVTFVREDVFRLLRRHEADGERFDTVVLDPPRMAARKRELKGALRGMKELSIRALRLLTDGGVLATACCTGLVSSKEFERVLRDAALDTGRRLTVLFARGAGPDHPWSVAAPESRYLKFLLARVE
jgi:23S rRNA (cytosine1962-C5)-methyltransferase